MATAYGSGESGRKFGGLPSSEGVGHRGRDDGRTGKCACRQPSFTDGRRRRSALGPAIPAEVSRRSGTHARPSSPVRRDGRQRGRRSAKARGTSHALPGEAARGDGPETRTGREWPMHEQDVTRYGSDEDSAFVAGLPEFAGCTARGEDQATASQSVRDATGCSTVRAHVPGRRVPQPKGERLMPAGRQSCWGRLRARATRSCYGAGTPPDMIVRNQSVSMFPPVRMTATLRPAIRSLSLSKAASDAAPAPSARLWMSR